MLALANNCGISTTCPSHSIDPSCTHCFKQSIGTAAGLPSSGRPARMKRMPAPPSAEDEQR